MVIKMYSYSTFQKQSSVFVSSREETTFRDYLLMWTCRLVSWASAEDLVVTNRGILLCKCEKSVTKNLKINSRLNRKNTFWGFSRKCGCWIFQSRWCMRFNSMYWLDFFSFELILLSLFNCVTQNLTPELTCLFILRFLKYFKTTAL